GIDILPEQQLTEVAGLSSVRANRPGRFLPVLAVHVTDRDDLKAGLAADRHGIAQSLAESPLRSTRADAGDIDPVVRSDPSLPPGGLFLLRGEGVLRVPRRERRH